jgi:hypothetical protein
MPAKSKAWATRQPSIEGVMNANGVSLDEARVIILNKGLKAWKSLLESNLQPLP